MKLLSFISGIKIEQGKLTTPGGTSYVGFKITISDGLPDIASQEHVQESVARALDTVKLPYEVHEETRENGKFKSYSIST